MRVAEICQYICIELHSGKPFTYYTKFSKYFRDVGPWSYLCNNYKSLDILIIDNILIIFTISPIGKIPKKTEKVYGASKRVLEIVSFHKIGQTFLISLHNPYH